MATDDRIYGESKAVNREDWLTQAVNELRPLFKSAGYRIPSDVRVSVGWPSSGGLATAKQTIGQCWDVESTADGKAQIFISPVLADSIQVADVLVHELGHVVCGAKAGHRGPFVRFCNKLGLEGKPTATNAGDELKAQLVEIVETLGDYPHAAIKPRQITRQKGRFVNVQCPDCGYNMYTTRKWLEVGTPTCCCGSLMIVPDEIIGDDEPEVELVPTTHALGYSACDGRFEVRYVKEPKPGWTRGERAWWHVIDYEAEAVRASIVETRTEVILDPGKPRTETLYTRHDAIGFIEAVMSGVYRWRDVELDDDTELDPGIDFDALDDDEFEVPDYPDDMEDYDAGIDEYPAPAESEV